MNPNDILPIYVAKKRKSHQRAGIRCCHPFHMLALSSHQSKSNSIKYVLYHIVSHNQAPPTTLCKSVLHSDVQKRCSISCCIVLALDQARGTQASDSAGTYFNSPSNTQTKCRNELSLQNGTAISELGLDFVITCSSIDGRTNIWPRSTKPTLK